MFVYTIHEYADCPAVETILSGSNVGMTQAVRDRVAELSGRPGILSGSISRELDRTGRIYIAANRGSEWREDHETRGFVVRREYVCGFCRGGTRPIGNAERWWGIGPAYVPCPACGSTVHGYDYGG